MIPLFLVVQLACTASTTINAQTQSGQPVDRPQSNPTNPLLQPIPFDSRITRDSLANGLKYFIKPNQPFNDFDNLVNVWFLLC